MTFKRLVSRLAVPAAAVLLAAVPAAAQPTELFFSEYVEGSSLNKVVEIYNGTGAAVDLGLGGYSVEVYFNGSGSAGTTIALSGVVADGDVFVVADDGAAAAILAETDQTTGASLWNGNDAVVLSKGGAVVDAIGQVGFNPGSQWGSGAVSTQDNTIRRQPGVCAGDTDETDAFDPAPEWDGFPNNTFDGLGAHSVTCVPAGPGDPLINEFVFNHTGSDVAEFVEVFGDPATDYSAFTVLEIEGDFGLGTIDGAFPVGTTDGAGFWFTGFFSNVIENGTVTLLLVEGFTGSAGDDLDADDDGTLDAAPWTRLVDSVAVTDGGAGDGIYSPAVLTPGFDGVPFTPGGASRIPDGADTDTAADWVRNDFDGEGLPGFVGDAQPGEAINTPGATNVAIAPPLPDVVINEVDADTPGIDSEEFVELFGDPGAPLDGLVVVFYNGNGDVSYAAFDLDGFNLDGDGFFVLGNAAIAAAEIVFPNNGLQNGADAVAVHVGDAADFPNGTAVTSANLVDALVYDTNDGDDAGLLSVLTPGGFQVNEGGGGNSSADSNSRRPDGGAPFDTSVYVQQAPTPGASNEPTEVLAEIYDIQGPGLTSPLVGSPVVTLDNAVTAVAPDGFFMQTPDLRADADPETSNGIFVFTGGAPAVTVGDRVDVSGTVQEFFDFTEIAGFPTVTVIGSGALPAAATFDAATPSPLQPQPATEYERYEGMRVTVAAGTVSGPNQTFGSDPIAEVHVVAGPTRAFREPGIEYPGLPGLPVWDGNPEVFELDPDRLGLANAIIPAGSSFTASGVLGYEFGGYELWPTDYSFVPAVLPRPVSGAQAGEMTVGSLNLFRLFDDVDDPGPEDDGQVVSTAEYGRRLGKFSLFIRQVMGSPDVVAVEEVESLSVLGDLAAAIAADDPAVVYAAYLEEGNDVGGIDVGFLVRDTVAVTAVTQLAAGEILTFDGSLLHDRPPLLLEATYTAGGAAFDFSVIAVHNRSLGGIESSSDGPRVRQKRLEQAQSIAAIVQDLQTLDPGIKLAVIGDFNAFEFSDGYVDAVGQIAGDFVAADNLLSGPDLVDPDLAKLTLALPPEERYSFNFAGSAQAIDHALTSQALTALVTSVEYARGNSDAARILLDDPSTPLRSSDHDGLVVYVLLDDDGDGVLDAADRCPGTTIPESVPTAGLNPNHFALVDGDGVFDTVVPPSGEVVPSSIGIADTAGCSCEQIIDELHLGGGQAKHGCSPGTMSRWIAEVQ